MWIPAASTRPSETLPRSAIGLCLAVLSALACTGDQFGQARSSGASGGGGLPPSAGAAGETAQNGGAVGGGVGGVAGAPSSAGVGGGGTAGAAQQGACTGESPAYRCIASAVLQKCNVGAGVYQTVQTCKTSELCDVISQSCVRIVGGAGGTASSAAGAAGVGSGASGGGAAAGGSGASGGAASAGSSAGVSGASGAGVAGAGTGAAGSAATAGGGGNGGDACIPGKERKFLISGWVTPTGEPPSSFEYDFFGLGSRNGYGMVQKGFAPSNFPPGYVSVDLQKVLAAAIRLNTELVGLSPGACGRIAIHPSPEFIGPAKFDGTDELALPAGNGLVEGKTSTMQSVVSVEFDPPLVLKVPFSFLVAVPATLYVVHVSFEPAKKTGQIHGLLRASDLNEQVKPALAAAYAAEIALDTSPGSRGAVALAIFDSDKDGAVSVQEVKDNSVIGGAFAPDFDAFDAAGNFAVSVDGIGDSLSVGIGFGAEPCTF